MGVRVHYREDGGDGERATVVLSGSLGSDLSMWDPQVPALLDAGLRVVRFDHRGHGGSPVPTGPYTMDALAGDGIALLDALGATRVHWVGLSLGGMVGMSLAQRAGARLASLTLCCTSAELAPQAWAERAQLVRDRGTAAVADAVVARWLTADYAASNPAQLQRLRDMVTSTPDEGYAACCSAIETMNLAEGLGAITAPTLVISGAQDAATPEEHGRRISAAIDGARFELLDPGAHLASVQRAEAVNELLTEHITRAAG